MRLHDWHARLVSCLAASAAKPFQMGQHDCSLFAADAVAAMTGRDIASDWRGRYTTLKGGIRVLRKAGYADHVALAAAHFPERDNPALAQPGDIAVVASDEGPALGIVQGELIYVLGHKGLGFLPLRAAQRVFEV